MSLLGDTGPAIRAKRARQRVRRAEKEVLHAANEWAKLRDGHAHWQLLVAANALQGAVHRLTLAKRWLITEESR